MTIKIIEAPSSSECWWHVCTNVRTVNAREIVLHSGETIHKNYFAKVEILSVMDAPEDWEELKAFYNDLHGYTEADWLKSPFEGYLSRMSNAKFDALDLPTHF